MYFKYLPLESDSLQIKEAKSVMIEHVRGGDGYILLPNDDERLCLLIDKTTERLAALLCDNMKAVKWRINQTYESETAISPVFERMYDDPYYDALAWYKTLEEANAEVDRIAAAIARGDKLYDLTQ